jgi:O-glycosyl hydrolase
MGSTDFSTDIYSYNPYEGDLNQTRFSIARDTDKIQMMKWALELNKDLRFFASPWAPPSWMTTTSSTIDCILYGKPGGMKCRTNFRSILEKLGIVLYQVS